MRRIIHFDIGKDETRSKLHIYIGNFVFVHRDCARKEEKKRKKMVRKEEEKKR